MTRQTRNKRTLNGTRPEQIRAALKKEPWLTGQDIADRWGISVGSITASLQKTWGVGLKQLRREVMQEHWQLKTPNPNKETTHED